MIISKEGSSFSLLNLPGYTPTKGGEATYIRDRTYDEIDKALPLMPWLIPTDATNQGTGEIHTDNSGVYYLMCKIGVFNITGTVEVSFRKDSFHICSSIVSCNSTCETVFLLNYYPFFAKDAEIKMSIIIDKPGIVVKKQSVRLINYIAPQPEGFAVSLHEEASFLFSSNTWKPVGKWTTSASLYGLYTNKVIIHKDVLLFGQSGTYQITCNIQVTISDDGCGKAW